MNGSFSTRRRISDGATGRPNRVGQLRAECADALPVNPAGWVSEVDIDFANTGAACMVARPESTLSVTGPWMIVPLGIIAVLNATRGRSWAFWALPLVMVAYLALEFVRDYVLKLEFRHSALLGPYLLAFCLAQFALSATPS